MINVGLKVHGNKCLKVIFYNVQNVHVFSINNTSYLVKNTYYFITKIPTIFLSWSCRELELF